MKITQGPWKSYVAQEKDHNASIESAEGIVIAYVERWILDSEEAIFEAQANARLIAAAPDLLAVAEMLMRAEKMQDGARDGATMGIISSAIDAARAALAD